MDLKLLVTLLLIKVVVARISLGVKIKNQEAELTYEGSEARTLPDNEFHKLIGKDNLRSAFIEKVRQFGFYRNSDACGPPNIVFSIKSAIVKRLKMESVVVVSQDFENSSNHTVKVNAGISHTVENTLTTSWSKEREDSVSKDVEYEVSVGFYGFGASVGMKNGYSFATKGGTNEEKTKSETIGTTSGVEVELKPGDAVTTVLSANAGTLEIEAVHQAYIKGDVPINCHCNIPFQSRLHVDKACESIEDLTESGGLENNFTTTETIKFSFFVEGKISVHERKRGQRKRRRVYDTSVRNATQWTYMHP